MLDKVLPQEIITYLGNIQCVTYILDIRKIHLEKLEVSKI